MTNNNRPLDGKVVLITGAAHRIGATTARILHAAGMNVVIHYRSSRDAAKLLQSELTRHREDSVVLIQADLHHTQKLKPVIREAVNSWGRLDALVNNA